eukprot:s1311_g1.t1
MPDDAAVRFFRITVLGASDSGKTSLINAFVNCSFMSRYVRTETARESPGDRSNARLKSPLGIYHDG